MTGADCRELDAVQSVIASVAHYIDGKRWALLRGLYSERVRTDYTSLFGGNSQEQGADDLIEGWRRALASVSTQHLLGPVGVRVLGSDATAECHVRAWHYSPHCPGGEEWVVGGHYLFALSKIGQVWTITSMTLQTYHQTGNLKLLKESGSG